MALHLFKCPEKEIGRALSRSKQIIWNCRCPGAELGVKKRSRSRVAGSTARRVKRRRPVPTPRTFQRFPQCARVSDDEHRNLFDKNSQRFSMTLMPPAAELCRSALFPRWKVQSRRTRRLGKNAVCVCCLCLIVGSSVLDRWPRRHQANSEPGKRVGRASRLCILQVYLSS